MLNREGREMEILSGTHAICLKKVWEGNAVVVSHLLCVGPKAEDLYLSLGQINPSIRLHLRRLRL